MATRALLPELAEHPERVQAARVRLVSSGPATSAISVFSASDQTMSLNTRVALAVVLLHVAVIAGLVAQRFTVEQAQTPVVMELLSVPAAPPPPRETPEILLETPQVVIPPPVFEIEDRPQTITAVVAETPPPMVERAPAPVQEAPPSPAPAGPPAAISGGDLSSSMIEAVPPKYPYESRRLKEQGTVILEVLLGQDGRVDRIQIHRSSGFQRLDKAALDAVRRWRWSPRIREGQPVAVRGLVELPFALTPRG